MHSSKEAGDFGMIIKLGMENAFDRVNLSFIFLVMEKLGFSNDFILWINACIGSPWIAPLINGHLTPFLAASRRLCQGRPLLPLLYIIMAEALSRVLEVERMVGSLPSLSIARNVKEINHSKFVDDALLIGGASLVIASRFKKILDWYIVLSRGLINTLKFQLIGWNCRVETMKAISHLLGFPMDSHQTSLPIFGFPFP